MNDKIKLYEALEKIENLEKHIMELEKLLINSNILLSVTARKLIEQASKNACMLQ